MMDSMADLEVSDGWEGYALKPPFPIQVMVPPEDSQLEIRKMSLDSIGCPLMP